MVFRRSPAAIGAGLRPPVRGLPVRGWALLLAGLAALPGCGSDELLDVSFVDPTEVAVDPDDFLGEVSCSPHVGAMRSYVMTLVTWDSDDDATPFVVASSRPASCAFVVGFRAVPDGVVIPGEHYTAFVDGYDVPSEQLVPFGGSSSGARQMRDRDSGAVIEPKWSTQCGGGASTAVTAQIDRRVYVRPCDPLEVSGDSPTQIRFSPSLFLGDEPCEVADSVDVHETSGAFAPTLDLACDAEPVVYDVDPGTYQLYVTAVVGGEPSGALCVATVTKGAVADPSCGPLSSLGNVRLSLSDLVDGDGEPVCPTGGSYDVVDMDEALNAVPLPCSTPAQIGPFEAGIRTFDVTVYGAKPNAATCAADVEPGRIVDAVCVP